MIDGALLALLLAGAVGEWSVARSLSRSTLAARPGAEQAEWERQIGSERARRDQLAAQVEALAAGRASPPPPGAPARRPASVLNLTPEQKKLVRAVQRAQLEPEILQKYGPLIASLGLTPQLALKLVDLLAEREIEVRSAFGKDRDQGLSPKSAWAAGVNDAGNAAEQKIIELLGPRYPQLQSYDSTIGPSNTVHLLERSLSETGTPLSPAQAAAMKRIITEGEAPFRLKNQENFNLLGFEPAPITINDIAQAKGTLDPAQMPALRQLRQQYLREQELRAALRASAAQ